MCSVSQRRMPSLRRYRHCECFKTWSANRKKYATAAELLKTDGRGVYEFEVLCLLFLDDPAPACVDCVHFTRCVPFFKWRTALNQSVTGSAIVR